jgi:hypothetical protein
MDCKPLQMSAYGPKRRKERISLTGKAIFEQQNQRCSARLQKINRSEA